MSTDPDFSLVNRIAAISPELEAARSEHAQDNGEVLPYVLMAEFVRRLEDSFDAGSVAVLNVLSVLDDALRFDAGARNLVGAGFLENLERGGSVWDALLAFREGPLRDWWIENDCW